MAEVPTEYGLKNMDPVRNLHNFVLQKLFQFFFQLIFFRLFPRVGQQFAQGGRALMAPRWLRLCYFM